MQRLLQIVIGLGAGLIILLWAWSIPAHWRDLDRTMLEEIGRGGERLLDTSQRAKIEGRWALATWSATLLDKTQKGGNGVSPEPVQNGEISFQEKNWQREWRELAQEINSEFWVSTRPSEALMKGNLLNVSREWSQRRAHASADKIRSLAGLTGRQFFPAAGSRAERPWLVALEVAAWLVQTGGVSPALENELLGLVALTASPELEVRMQAIQHLEGFMVSLLSMGRRYNWEELPVIMRSVGKAEELPTLAQMVAQFPEDHALIGVALYYVGRVHPLLHYRSLYPQHWLKDLEVAVPYGRGAVRALVLEEQILYRGPVSSWIVKAGQYIPKPLHITAQAVTAKPDFWLRVKTAGIFVGALFLSLGVAALLQLRPFISRNRIPWWNPLLIVRQVTMALCISAVLMWAGEPGLLRNHLPDTTLQSAGFSIQLNTDLPSSTEENTRMIPEFDNLTWLMLGLFFSLQLLIYIIGLLKIAQIRSLQLDPALKLELLANEENLFDCGLYLGIGGTVTALVMLAMHILQPSLVAAYSSTLFGILFVALLKVGHVRPYRRQLLLNRENIVAL